eukprot:EG_transcript_20769
MRQATLSTFGYGLGQSSPVTSHPPKALKRKAVKEVVRGTQQFIDAGQKVIGAIRCKACGMLYTPGTEDDTVHARFCQKPAPAFAPFLVTKGHRIISEDEAGCVVLLDSTDKAADLKRVALLKAEVERCAAPEEWQLAAEKAFLLVRQKNVVGFALAEQIEHACLMEEPPEEAQCTIPAVLGLRCLWAAPSAPSPHSVYQRLLEAAQQELVYGYRVPAEKVAFFRPSDAVQAWARQTQLRPLAYWTPA